MLTFCVQFLFFSNKNISNNAYLSIYENNLIMHIALTPV